MRFPLGIPPRFDLASALLATMLFAVSTPTSQAQTEAEFPGAVVRAARLVEAVVTQSPGYRLSDAAPEAVRESRFRPGFLRGRAVKVRFSMPVDFHRDR